MQTTILSVDLDDYECYRAIHGLDPAGSVAADEFSPWVFERWLPRLFGALDALSATPAHATLFVIGRALERDLDGSGRGAALLRQAAADGHELGNHSYAHDYRMSEWSQAEIAADLDRADRALAAIGARALGFRAPGYTSSMRLSTQVAARGFLYDSSSLPSPSYYLAKLGVLAAMRVRGRKSASSVRGTGGFFGRSLPHIRSTTGMWEIPISVTGRLRMPFVGGLVLGGAASLQARMMAAALEAPFLHLQLHAIDFADPEADGMPPALVRLQPELRVPLATRIERLQRLLTKRGGAGSIASMLPTPNLFDLRVRAMSAMSGSHAREHADRDGPAPTTGPEIS